MDDHAARVLALVAEPDYQPMTLKAMAKRFEVAEDEYPEFRTAVKGLIKAGQLDIAKDKTLRKAELIAGTIIGTFRRSSKGFGFVRPDAARRARPTRSSSPSTPAATPRPATRSLVKIVKQAKGPGFNPEGRIVQVVARASGLFVGTYFEKDGGGLRQDRRHDLPRPDLRRRPRGQGGQARRQGRARDGPLSRPPTAKGRGSSPRSSAPGASPGSTPSPSSGPSASPTSSTTTPSTRPASQAKAFDEDDVDGRLDLRDQLTVTIDPATARDFDDAITLTRDEKGFWTLGVHIADVSHFVRPGSPLDRHGPEARDQRLPARPRHPDAPGGPLQQPGQPPGRARPLHRQRLHGVQPRRRPDRPPVRPVGDPGRPPVRLRAGLRGHPAPRGRARRRASTPRSGRCSAGCSSWR